jgi:putative membrane protein
VRSGLKEFIQRWIITTVGVLVATHVVPGIDYRTWPGLLVATLVLGLLSAFVKPVLVVLSLPLVVVTLGLFMLVINAVLLYVVGQLFKDFQVDSFGAAFWGGVIISIVTLGLNSITKSGSSRIEVKRGKRPDAPKRPDDPGGPVIDV